MIMCHCLIPQITVMHFVHFSSVLLSPDNLVPSLPLSRQRGIDIGKAGQAWPITIQICLAPTGNQMVPAFVLVIRPYHMIVISKQKQVNLKLIL